MVLLGLAPTCRFGRFLLETERRTLSAEGQALPLSSRGFDILVLLVEHRDRVVTKDEIFANVWRGMVVEENNLAVQISALRRLLGEGPGGSQFIMTAPGRGYRFVAPVEEVHEAAPVPEPPPVKAIPAQSPNTAPQFEFSPSSARRRRPIVPLASAFVVVLLLGWVGWRYLRPQNPVAPRLSIVVLPFRNLGEDTRQDYLADAISDDLTTDLSHIPGSVVIARESADTYKGRPVGTDTIGRALHVRYILQGSLRDEGQALHINAQLIDAASGSHLWANTFDVTRDRLGQAREEIVRHIASALDFTLVQVEGARSLHERPDNPDAVDLYLRARSILDRGATLDSLGAAQDLLERSVAAAPEFGDALAELGLVLLQKISGFDDPAEGRDYARARAVIGQAGALAPHDPASVTASGMLAFMDGRCQEAQPDFRLALSLDPTNVQALMGLSRCARALGQMDEMIADMKEVLRVDPVGPRNAPRDHIIGMGYLMLGHPQEALTWFERAGAGLEDTPGAGTTLGWQEWRRIYMIAATQLSGNTAAAAKLYADYNRILPHRTVWQLGSYDSHALSFLPGHKAYMAALHAAGMPDYADETADFGASPSTTPKDQGDFDPTPLNIPGAQRIDTASLEARLTSADKPRLLDLGLGAGVLPGAIWIWEQGLQGNEDQVIVAAKAGPVDQFDRPVVVLSDGPFGWRSYNAALHLVANGFHHVLWYRGGEAAWAASGLPAEDKRSP